ncbi:signal recognition particle-docking protein FtsY [Candidatus Kinetoplastidibacterium crithidiae]|uniref:Fused signal recognition particle receptor n=1 Tax=Candidatus Kinetoplastidibacterium crithidiae TCC036E TaxID=1208918 RepID=M1LTX4_9PROT|nr:signal recognition particle-docking protein FtsY [Candidatus Kinetoplastibacterium crithidii]AFZ82786.1 fused signal recognition particle receptor [Candidatus Kinetoplastibacterium crithidii (ex Angomonas deanei ATCC 30255)]AGF47561.1 fused signal recognition particle receptor [Candidatus Kinetoplastibacterium crithidii TCC036E]
MFDFLKSKFNKNVSSSNTILESEEKILKEDFVNEQNQENINCEKDNNYNKYSIFTSLKKSLSNTSNNLNRFFRKSTIDEAIFEDLESALIMSDVGFEASSDIINLLKSKFLKRNTFEIKEVKNELYEILTDRLKVLESKIHINNKPSIFLIVGANGVGKTTSIGKIASYFKSLNLTVLLVAADTFRAAAVDQLQKWGDINNIMVYSKIGIQDPSSVVFDGINFGRAKNVDVIIIDSAGRLPSNINLMNELTKVKKVISKANNADPYETILVLDANSGQNNIAQISAFDNYIGISGLFMAKLDGTAKGGILVSVAYGKSNIRKIPVYWIGVGENKNDILSFVAKDFVAAILDK